MPSNLREILHLSEIELFIVTNLYHHNDGFMFKVFNIFQKTVQKILFYIFFGTCDVSIVGLDSHFFFYRMFLVFNIHSDQDKNITENFIFLISVVDLSIVRGIVKITVFKGIQAVFVIDLNFNRIFNATDGVCFQAYFSVIDYEKIVL